MARQSRWNRSFWKKMDHFEKMEEKSKDPMLKIMANELGKVEGVMLGETPILFGGLIGSHYTRLVPTPHGYSAQAGYERKQHINLDPNLPPGESRIDAETNPEVMNILSKKPNRAEQVADINEALDNFQVNCRNRIKEWFRAEMKKK